MPKPKVKILKVEKRDDDWYYIVHEVNGKNRATNISLPGIKNKLKVLNNKEAVYHVYKAIVEAIEGKKAVKTEEVSDVEDSDNIEG